MRSTSDVRGGGGRGQSVRPRRFPFESKHFARKLASGRTRPMFARTALEEAQNALGLQGRDELFCALIGVDGEQLRAARREDEAATPQVLQAAADALGIEPHELLHEGAAGRASTVLLKSFANPEYASAFEEVVAQGVHRELGRFARTLRRKAWLRHALGKAQPEFPREIALLASPTPPAVKPPFGADDLAVKVRERLKLGDEPIVDMLALVRDRLHIEVRATRTLWSAIDGASFSTRTARGILVNLSVNPTAGRIRMTLAHELAHVLFDGGAFEGARTGALLVFSPARQEPTGDRVRDRRDPSAPFRALEQRANAFAAYLLAPPSGVRGLFGRHEPPMTASTVDKLVAHYGLSRHTAVNVLTNVYGWTREDRQWVLELTADSPPPDLREFHTDLDVTPDNDDELRALADEALTAGRLTPAMRSRWLGEPIERAAPVLLAGDHPSEYWLHREAAEAVGEIREHLTAGKSGAALRVLWDSLRDWIAANDLPKAEALIDLLACEDPVDEIVINLGVLTATTPTLAVKRQAYLAAVRARMARDGRSPAEIDAILRRAER